MSEPRKSRIDPSIIAAVIGVCGTVMVTLITLVINNQRAPQATPPPNPTGTAVIVFTSTIAPTPVPTDTVPVGEPSSTPDTPTPPPTPTLIPGVDWATGCISAQWKPYPSIQTTENNGCLPEPVHLFFAADGRLTFLVNDRFANTDVYGMFAPLSANGTASIDVFLRNLQDGEI